jgi:hypothetical protein
MDYKRSHRMFKRTWCGIASISLALSFVTGTANASFGSCTSVKSGAAGMTMIKNTESPLELCDVTFINPPVFGILCADSTVTATYTIQNNTPVTLKITYIRLQDNDSFPAGDAVIVPAAVNPCGSSIAAGATCQISVKLTSTTTPGSFNRVLQVGISSRQGQVSAPAITTTVDTACTTPPPIPPAGFVSTIPGTPSYLYSASILGATTVTNTGPTIVSGDLDLTPGSAVTGFPPGTIVNGVLNIDNTAATNVRTAASNYFTALNGLGCTSTPVNPDISALSPISCATSPVFCFGAATMTAPVTITGAAGETCTFKIASTLTVSPGATMTKAGTIFNDNISWAIGSSATLGTTSSLIGIVDALASITLNTGASLNGRAWALTGAVTLDDNAVSPQG